MDNRRLGREIRCLANLIGRSLNKSGFSPEAHGITGPQGLILGYLYEHQDIDVFQKNIESCFNIRRSTATGLLKSLEMNGFIQRISVEHDARLKKIILTKMAKDFREVLEAHLNKVEDILLQGLEPQEIDELIRLIGKVKKNLE